MTDTSPLRRLALPLASAAGTALVLVTALWVQHLRGSWPFTTPAAGVPAQGTAETTSGTSGTDPGAAPDRTWVDSAAARSLDIQLETVRRQPLTQTIRAVATVAPDESRISHVHTRVAGWVEHLDVNTTGAVVRAGQPVARIFSQELLASQTEYLSARQSAAGAGISTVVLASGRTRLGVLGMSPGEIEAIERSGQPRRLVTIVAPRPGVVVNRGVTVGTSVDPSTTLLTIADLSRVWVLAEVPEASIRAVRTGLLAELDFPASGRAPFAARVEFVSPMLTDRSRTLQVRLGVPNPNGEFRPGLYGTAAFTLAGEHSLSVPRDAVVDTGLEQHVFVAVEDRFEPRTVIVGTQLGDRLEIRAGLREGEQIVVAGVFLLDSESRLRATGRGPHNHGPAPAERQGPPPADPHAGHRE